MMKFLMLIFMLIFMFNLMNYYIIQLFFQMLFFMIVLMFMVSYPMNNMNFWVKIYYNMGYDYYSLGLILLSLWILLLMSMMSMMNYLSVSNKFYLNVMMFLLLMLLLCFMMINIMMFYLFFESSLIPVFFLIMGWGFQVDRIQAGFYMMLYTLVGSMPLFYIILLMYKMNKTLMFMMVEVHSLSLYLYLMMMVAFLIKMPMYMLHLWLPKAHVEAPLVGSMVLAGIMLKLGSYGLMRFMLMLINMCVKFNKFVILISLMGGVYCSLICLCQVDMKMLVAYSSVVHMSILMGGLMTLYNWGYLGSILMMIAHGLCSSGMFCLVNINYERLGSRSLIFNKGLINLFPSLSMMWFMMCSSNLSFPPSLNLFSELILLNSLMMWSKELMLIMMLIMFFSASYSLYLYSFSQHGSLNKMLLLMNSIMVNEYLGLLLHWVPLNYLFLMLYIYI